MLGLAPHPLAQCHTTLFAAAAVEVMRAVRACHPDRRTTQMHSLYARGPGPGIGPLAVPPPLPQRAPLTHGVMGAVSSPGSPAGAHASGVGASLLHPPARAEACGYEPARVHPLAAVRIVEQVVRWGRAFNFAPVQHFARAMVGDEVAWSVAWSRRGRRQLTSALLQCYQDTFDWRAWVAELDVEAGIDGEEDGARDDVIPFEHLLRTSDWPAHEHPATLATPASRHAAPAHGSVVSPPAQRPAAASTPTISTEYLLVGVMAAWTREWQRISRSLDAAFAAWQLRASETAVQSVVASLQAQLHPLLADVESLRKGTADSALASLDPAAAASKSMAVAEERLGCGGVLEWTAHPPTAHAVLAAAYRKLLVGAVGSMVRVQIEAAAAHHAAERKRAAAQEAAAAASAQTARALAAEHASDTAVGEANAAVASHAARAAQLTRQLEQALAAVDELQRKNTELVITAADEAEAVRAAEDALAQERARRATAEAQLAEAQASVTKLRDAYAASASQLERERSLAASYAATVARKHAAAIESAAAAVRHQERERVTQAAHRVALSAAAMRQQIDAVRQSVSAAAVDAEAAFGEVGDAIAAAIRRHNRAVADRAAAAAASRHVAGLALPTPAPVPLSAPVAVAGDDTLVPGQPLADPPQAWATTKRTVSAPRVPSARRLRRKGCAIERQTRVRCPIAAGHERGLEGEGGNACTHQHLPHAAVTISRFGASFASSLPR